MIGRRRSRCIHFISNRTRLILLHVSADRAAKVPQGRSDNSPAVLLLGVQSAENESRRDGRTEAIASAVPAGLDRLPPGPSVETLGYYRSSLRDGDHFEQEFACS